MPDPRAPGWWSYRNGGLERERSNVVACAVARVGSERAAEGDVREPERLPAEPR